MERVEIEPPAPFVNLEGKSTKPKRSKKAAAASGDKKKKKKRDKSEAPQHVPLRPRLCARARARALCRVMELRTSITRQETQYMDRVALSLGAFNESRESKYGTKILSALDSFAMPREKPDELIHDLALLRNLEAEIEHGTTRADNEIQDDDLNELAACLREEVNVLRESIQNMRRSIASLEKTNSVRNVTLSKEHMSALPLPPDTRLSGPPLPPTS